MLAFILGWVVVLPLLTYLVQLAVESETKGNRVIASVGSLLGFAGGIFITAGLNFTLGTPIKIVASLLMVFLYATVAKEVLKRNGMDLKGFIAMAKPVKKKLSIIGVNYSTYPRKESIDNLNDLW